MNSHETPAAPYWNVLAIALPAAAALLGATILGSKSHGGSYGAALGAGVKMFLPLGVACAAGEAAAIASLVKLERMAWLSVIGVIVNAAVLLPALYLASRIE